LKKRNTCRAGPGAAREKRLARANGGAASRFYGPGLLAREQDCDFRALQRVYSPLTLIGKEIQMKKNLPALAVLTLLCGAAYAQSSVTLYGVADVGIGKVSGQKTGMISGTDINHTTSYIGFRGIEDLGGGLKAGFKLEQYINMENGAAASTNGFIGSQTYGRAANLWLEGGFGQFKMG